MNALRKLLDRRLGPAALHPSARPGRGGCAERPAPLAVDYVHNHNTGERCSLEVARLHIGEWQPESERAELAEFLADRDPGDPAAERSRDFTPLGSGAVVLSRGVRFIAPAAVCEHPAGERSPAAASSTRYAAPRGARG